MMVTRFASSLIVMSLGLFAAGCSTATKRELAEIKPIGPEVRCLQTQDIRSTNVIDDQTIDFITRRGDVFRNRLPFMCPQLSIQRSFTYTTSINQLCSVDIINVIIQGQAMTGGASCGLGLFTPIARPVRGIAYETPAREG